MIVEKLGMVEMRSSSSVMVFFIKLWILIKLDGLMVIKAHCLKDVHGPAPRIPGNIRKHRKRY